MSACVRCGRDPLPLPEPETLRKVADDLNAATAPPPGVLLWSAVGSAVAYLRIFEAYAASICLFCMDPLEAPEWGELKARMQ